MRRNRNADDSGDNKLVWQIALGIVLGLLILRACDRYEENQRIDEANKAIEKMVESWPKPQARREPMQVIKASEIPLRADERCIDHQRFRRVENGWVQNGDC